MYTVLYSRSASGSGRFLYTRLPICVSSFFVVYDPISTGTGTALLSCTVLPYTNRRSGKRPGGPNRSDKTPFGPTSHSIGAIAAIASENAAIAICQFRNWKFYKSDYRGSCYRDSRPRLARDTKITRGQSEKIIRDTRPRGSPKYPGHISFDVFGGGCNTARLGSNHQEQVGETRQ